MIENLIFDALKTIPSISKCLATYSGKPAIFYQQAPHDKDPLWGRSGMFPRIIYNVNWQYHAERKTNGSMTLELYCTNKNILSPEEVAKGMIDYLSELFLTDESGTYCLLWDKMDHFDPMNHFDSLGKEPLIYGVSMTFLILFFPEQEGSAPCPVWSLNHFIKQLYPNCILLGHDPLPDFLKASAQNPVVYVKKANTASVKTSYAMAWVSEDVVISILSSDLNETRRWIHSILRELRIEGETIMENGSPFLIKTIGESTSNDILQTGQIVLSGEYGMMRRQKEEIRLHHVHMKKEG